MFSRILGFSIALIAITLSRLAFAAPDPGVTNSLPPEGLAGEQVCFDAAISNGGDPGFSPYLRILADADLQIDSATSFGSSVSITSVGTFSNDPADAPFELEDPFTETDVTGQQGQSFSLVRKLVGSVVANGPEISTNICVTISNSAQIGTPLNLSITPVFQLGDTATGDNGPVEGMPINATITPTLFDYTFAASAPEQERVPNEAVSFTHTFDVADGSTLEQAAVEQMLDTAFTAIAAPTVTGGIGCTVNSAPSTSSNGGTLDVSCNQVVGSSANDELKVTLPAVIGDVLSVASCAALPINNQSAGNAEFPVGTPLATANRNAALNIKHLTLQQNISSGTVVPGDVLTVTNNIRISEFATPDGLVIVDTISDGLAFNDSVNLIIGGVSYTVIPTETTNAGEEIVTFDLTSLYTGTPAVAAAKTLTLSYSVVVEQTFTGGGNVLTNDDLSISTQATYGLNGGASACTDGSGSGATVQPISILKSLVGGATEFEPGESVTFRLRVNVPSGDINTFTITDFLPLPVFDVSTINTTFGNDITFGANDDLAQQPTSITTNTATNALILTYSDLSGISGNTIELDIATTLSTDPYSDPLALTNIMELKTNNSSGDGTTLLSPVALEARAPVLEGTLTQTLPAQKDGDGEINFSLELENTGGADAFDIGVVAPTVAGLDAATLASVVIENSDGSVANASPSTTGNFTSGTFTVAGPVEPSQVLVVLYDRLISDDVTPTQTITSTSETIWSGSPFTTTFPKIESELEFDVDDFSLATTIDSISPGGGSSGNIVVGDTVTYLTTVTMPESEVDDFTITVELPAGLSYVPSSASPDATGFGGTVPGVIGETVTGTVAGGQTVTLELTGTLATTSDNNTANNSFGVTFDALVADVTQNDGKENTQAKAVNTSANFVGSDGSNSAAETSTNFAEHELEVTTVTTRADGATSGFEAGDVIDIAITVENIGTAPAYDIALQSLVNGDLFDLSTVTDATTPAGFTYGFSSPTVAYTGAGTTLNDGDSITFIYRATVADDVTSGSNFTIDNTATGSSQSGTPSVERSGTSEEEAVISTEAPAIGNLQVIATSEAWTGTSTRDIFAIGEVVTYEFETSLPEGITAASAGAGYTFEVQLPTGYEYQASSALIRAEFDSSINSAVAGNLSTTNAAITPTQTNNNLRFTLGELTNNDDDADEEKVIVTFDLLVKNLRNNNRNNTKKVNAKLVYTNTASQTQSRQTTAVSRIGEPRLRLDYRVRASTVNGGATVFYDTTLRNLNGTYNTRAWDFVLEQEIPADLTPVNVVSAVLSRGNLDISSCVSLLGQIYTLDTGCLAAGQEYLDKNERITVRVEASVDPNIQFEQQATGRAEFSATSLPGTNGTSSATPGVAGSDNGERTGSRVVNDSGQSVNDLYLVRTATVTAESPTVDLVLNEERLQIGETLTITSDVAIPTGSTDDFEVTLTLPTGLAYENETIRITEPSSGFSASATPNINPGSGLSTITLDFGDIANSGTQPQDLTIEFDVVIDNLASNQNGTVLTPSVALEYSSRGVNVPSASEQMTVVEANVELTQTIIAGATGSDAGDTITYRTVIKNTSGQATAYNVSLQDVLDTELLGAPDGSGSGTTITNITVDNIANQAVLTNTSTVVSASDFGIQTTNASDDTIALIGNMDMPADSSLVLEYTVVVANSAIAGADVSNVSSASYNSNAAADSRSGASANSDDDDNADLNNYNESASSTLTLADNLAVQSSLNPVHSTNDFTVGDTVFIDIRVDINEGQEPNASITNVLPAGLSFVAATIDAPSTISYSGTGEAVDTSNSVAIDFGTITNGADNDATNDFITITVEALVLEDVANVEGTTLTNSVTATAAGSTVGPNTLEIDIVEPDVVATITPSRSVITLGDVVTFSVDVSATDFATDAQDTSFDIAIPAGFTYQAGSLAGPGLVDDSDASLLSVDIGALAADDGVKTFIFEAQLDNDARIGVDFDFALQNATFSSQAGTPTNNRDYTFAASTSVRSDDASFIDAQQTLVITNDVNGDGVADPGDTLGKTVTLTNNGPRVSGVIFEEEFPTNTTYVGGSLSSTAGTTDDSTNASVDVGEMLSDEIVVIEFEFVVDAGTPTGTVIVAQGTVDSDSTIPEPTDTDATDSNGDQANQIRIGGASDLAPALVVTQNISQTTDADNDGAVSEGDQLTVTYTLQNTGTQDLSNVSLADLIPTGLTSANNSATISGPGDSNDTVNVTASAIDVVLAELAAGEIVTVTVLVDIDAPLVNEDGTVGTEVFSMQGSVNSDQTNTVQADGNNNADDGAQPITITAIDSSGTAEPVIAVAQSYVLVNDVDGDGLVDPGDTVEYLTNITNTGSATATDVSASQTIPSNTTAVAGSRSTSKGVIANTGAGNYDANIGSIAPGETVSTSFLVVIDSAAEGTLLSSQQAVSGDGFTTVNSDANNDLSDGATPTLINVVGSSPAPEYSVATTLSATSDIATTGNNFIQGETLTLSFTADFPAGLTRDSRMFFDLPAGFEDVGVTARVKRVFDNNVSAGDNPGSVNAAANDTFVNVTPEFVLSNGTDKDAAFIDLGNVFNTDNDADGASYVVELIIDTASIVPTSATQSFTIGSSLQYNNELLVAQTEASDDVVVVLNNQNPVANVDSVTVVEDTILTMITPVSNDTDADTGQTLNILSVGTPSQGGAVTFDAMMNIINYRPADDFVGTETIAYTITDGAGGTSTALITVSVTGTNDDPVVVVDNVTTNEDTPLTIDALDNDTDIDGDTLTITSASSPNGTVTINGDGDLVFTPAANFNGPATITYAISDGNGGTASGTVNVTVNAVNDDPVVPNQTLSTNEDTALTINPLAGATDAEGDTLTVTGVTASSGTVTVNPDGSLNFEPADDETGPVTITYTVEDGNGGSTVVTVTVNVTPQNDDPVAQNDNASTNEDTAVTIDVLDNDSDVDGDTLSVTTATSPDGTVAINGDGDLVFTPNTDFNGSTTISYTVSDGNGGTDTATVDVTVTAVNDDPVVGGQTLTTEEDTPLTIDPLLGASDVDGDTLTVTDIVASSGTVTVNPDGTLEFVPDEDFSGPVTITYNVDDGNGGVVSVTVTVNVTPVGDAPTANPDTITIAEDGTAVVDVISNDTDADGDALSITNASSNDGTVTVLPNGDVQFTPNPDFTGIAVVFYTLEDATGAVDTGTLKVTVTPENDAPVVPDQILAGEEDMPVSFDPLANGLDVDGDTLSVTNIVTSSGSVTQNPDGTITFTPDPDFNGPVLITYTVDDGNGGTVDVTVTINVAATMDPPVANPDTATTPEDTAISIDVVANDTDPDGDTVFVTAGASPDGTVTVIAGEILFTPNPDFTGAATISYSLSDGSGEQVTGIATVEVTPVNDPPVASDQTLSVEEDTALIIDPLINATDVDGDTLTIANIVVSSGNVTQNPDGTITFTPDANFNGPVTITYLVDDGNGGTTPVTVNVNVQPIVDAPIANPDAATTNEDTPVIIDVLDNDTDVENEALTVIQATSPDGTIEIDSNGDVVFTPNPDFTGEAVINYVVQDASGEVGISTATVTVVPVNDDPVVPDQSLSINEDTPLTINPLLNAVDVDGDSLSVTDIVASSGTVTVNPDGSLNYEPAPDFTGTVTITYNVDDGNGGIVPVTITIDVVAINDAPVGVDDSASTNEDSPVTIDVLNNDTDVDGETLTATNPTSSDGTVTVNGDGDLVFTPNADFNGTATITYTVDDGNGGTDTATVTVTVVAVNDPPVAPGQSLVVAEDTPLVINPLLGATDADGDSLIVTGVVASSGTVTLNPDGTVTFTPAIDFVGPVTITYLVDDGNGGTVPVTITIDVTAVNDAPVAVNDAASTNEDSPVVIDALNNDSDVDGDTLTISSASSADGTVTVNGDGELVFMPNPDFNGTATISYTIDDGNGGSATATVAVTVAPINDAPVGVAQSLSTDEDMPLTFNPLLGATDADGDTLTASDVVASSGTVTLNPDGSITFEPDPDFNGTVTIIYTIDDGNGGTTTVTSTIEVQAQSDAPVANPDTATTAEESPVVVDVLGNDTDADGDSLGVSNASSNDGEVVVLPNGDIQFTPAPDFTGVAVVTYTLIDETGAVDTGTVSINVTPVNDPPVVPDQILVGEEDTPVTFNPLENGLDVDGDTLTVSDVVASSGTVTQNPDGTITFTPDPDFSGPVLITYKVGDGNGGTIEVTVTINVAPTMDPPVANPDTAITPEDTAISIDVVANDTDPDGDTVFVTAGTSPDGTVTVIDGEIFFTPNPDFTGTATISYSLSDGNGEQVTGTASVDVTPVNDPPEASDQTLSTEEDTAITFDPLINASDVDGDTLSISGVVASSGTVVINPDGTITFTPDANFNGPVAITYTIDDGNGGTVEVTVNINVLAVVDAPVANPDTASTNEDTPVTIDVLSNDTDVENEVLTVISATSADGSVEIASNGELVFTPNENFNGEAEITYVIEDESGQVASTTVSVTVAPVNDAPIAPNLTRVIDEDTVLNIDVLGLSSDPDGDNISISSVSADIGEVTIGPDGTIFFTPPADYEGPAVITYTIDDGNGGTTTASITIDVMGINDTPAIEDTAVTVEGNGTSVIDIFDLIVDPDSSEFEIVDATVTVGTITINDDGTITFEPPFGFEGEVTAIVCVVDEAGAEVCATITITVVITNTPPVADSLSFVTSEDTSVQIEISATDAQLDPISFTLQSMPNGELIGTAPNFTYIPPTDFEGETSFTYIASDAELDSEVATVTITVIAVNDPPIAFDDFVNMTDMMGSVTIDVLDNDVDADGDVLNVISAQATIGEVTIVDNQLVFIPPTGFVGVAVIEYVITDPDGETSTARVLVNVGRDDDSDFPVIDVPDDIFIDATALYTKVDLGVATAVDRFGNPLPVSVIDGLILYEPGVNTVFYVAVDSEGRRSIATQLVRVNPLISIQKDQSVLEGRNMRVSVHLNGQAPVYPLVVPFEVTGTADSGDHNLISGEVVFNNVTETFIDFEGFADNIEEGIETIVITLSDTVNIGNKFEHVIDIREDNVNPEIDIIPTQNDIQTNFILNTAGLVTVESLITHPDPNNEYDFVWTNVEDVLADIDSEDFTYTFDPSDVPVGVYQINVEITDRDDPDFNDNTVLFLQITDTIPELGSGDADMDGIPDNLEGFNDSDGDGIPDYLDAIPECNVLPEEVDSLDAYLVEGDPGVCLRIGNFALGQETGGARILDEELGPEEDVPTDPIATNIGGIFDFIAYGLPLKGQSYRIVLPQQRPVPENAVYRKFTEEDGWQFFDETGGNRLWSTPGEPGFCPPPGGDYWTPGLNPGHWCVQLEIVDGGPNDADDMANKNIIDPGFVGVVFAQPNELPVAEDDARETRQEVPVTVDALNNDSDPDGDELTITSVNSFFGTVSIVDNQVFYEPAFGFTGIDVVSYGITDGNGGTDVATITITVVGNLPPIAVDDSAVVDVGESVTIDAINNDSDPDGGSISITDATVDQGEVRIVDGQIVYTAPVGFNGEVIITYTITNSEGLIAIAQIRVTVNEVLVRIRNESSGGSVGILLMMMLVACGVYRRRRWLQDGFNPSKLNQKQLNQPYTSAQGASHE